MKPMMVKLQVKTEKLLKSVHTGHMFKFDWMLIEVVVQEMLKALVVQNFVSYNHKTIVDVPSAEKNALLELKKLCKYRM